MTERRRAVLNIVRSVKIGGHIIVKIPLGACRKQEFKKLCEDLGIYGCYLFPTYTGEVESTDNEGDNATSFYVATGVVLNHKDGPAMKRDLPPDSLTLTHASNWPKSSDEKKKFYAKRQERKLPYDMQHNAYMLHSLHRNVTPRTFSTGEISAVHQAQVEHLRTLEGAARAIRAMAHTPEEFRALDAQQRRTVLEQSGVEYLPSITPEKGRPVFRLKAYPQHFFYPYDGCFEEKQTEA